MLRRIPPLDWLVAALFAAVAAIECTFLVDYGPRWPYVLNAAIHLALVPVMLLRRARPVPSFVAAYALLAALALVVRFSPVNLGVSPALFAAPLAVLAITRHGPSPRWGRVALVLGVAGSFVSPLRGLGTGFGIALHVLAIVACYLWESQQRQLADRYARDLAEQARAHEDRAALAAAAERTLLAGEVHDIVAHHLAVVRVQASTALAVGDEAAMRAALATIKEVTGDALSETRELVGSLRAGEPAGPAGDVTALPERVGVGQQRRWPARTRLTVLRVVQEALTNLIRHGAGECAIVVAAEPGAVTVHAHNAGRKTTDVPGGHGLAGVRERLELAGGSLRAGPDGDGWTLVATIPVTGAA